MAKQLSQAAQVAKIARKIGKDMGLKIRARSSYFAGGNDVTVTVYDATPNQINELKSALAKYRAGHFDGMTDMYEYSNHRDDIPQTKYLSIDPEYSDEIKQAAWDLLRTSHNIDLPVDYSQLTYNDIFDDECVLSLIHQILRGNTRYVNFWNITED